MFKSTKNNVLFKFMANEARVVRIMTNTAAMIQQGCSVYSKGKYATDGMFRYFWERLEFNWTFIQN